MKQVGTVSSHVASLLGLQGLTGFPIYLGVTNIQHMKTSHPQDYAKYGSELENILAEPDYVAENPKDGSLEYVKEYCVDNEYVKVAVRVSGGGKLYARSLYVLSRNRVMNFIAKGTLKKT